jgi:hypothetical protein
MSTDEPSMVMTKAPIMQSRPLGQPTVALNGKPFDITEGVFQMKAMQSTCNFIASDLEFFNYHMQSLQAAFSESGPICYVHTEGQWTTACKLDEVEMGALTKANGFFYERNNVKVDQVFAELV